MSVTSDTPPESVGEAIVHTLDDGGELVGDRLEPLVVVDAKMGRFDGPPLQIRITRRASGANITRRSKTTATTRQSTKDYAGTVKRFGVTSRRGRAARDCAQT